MQGLREFLTRSTRNYVIAVATVALIIAIAVALTTGVLGGSGPEKTFDAQSFIDVANGKGAGLALGEPLISAQKDVEVFAISFDRSGNPNTGAGSSASGSGEGHGAASLTISPDSAAALQVYDRCEATGTFVCYRANNASLVFADGADPHALANVDAAIRALASN